MKIIRGWAIPTLQMLTLKYQNAITIQALILQVRWAIPTLQKFTLIQSVNRPQS